jgi:hypothetical protein
VSSYACVIPDLDKSGLLPAGIHWATLEEVDASFGTNPHRKKLLAGFKIAVQALKLAGCKALYLDGSFVTAKQFPSDYDACWEAAGVVVPNLDPVFLDFSNRRAAQKTKYLGEFFLAYSQAEGPPLYRMFINFFQVDKDTGNPKGIVGIKL